MNARMTLTLGLLVAAVAPAKEVIRIAGKCAKEAVKDIRDAERERKRARPDNKWDELCAPPPLPIPTPPPAVEPPPLIPPPPPATLVPLPPP